MKLAVITSAFFPIPVWEERLNFFVASCKKLQIPFLPYGVGEPYCLWAEMKIVKKIPVFNKLIQLGFTHVLYSDSRDAFFCAGLDEIIGKYKRLGSPNCLASTEKNCNPNAALESEYPRTSTDYRFHCVGGYIAEIEWVKWAFERMLPLTAKSGDDAEIWQWCWKEGWFRPRLDSNCEIFQTADRLEKEELVLTTATPLLDTSSEGIKSEGTKAVPRLLNTKTQSLPCVFHLNGGHSDPITGKYDAMLPWWSLVHPEIKVERPQR